MAVPKGCNDFNKATGWAFNGTQLLVDARMQKARQLLTEDDTLSVSDIAYKCGFSDPHYFSRSFKQRYGVTPTEVR